ncbi:MAG: hypothetical protein KIT56_10040 [Gammaproteobacteria bacterium]|nr:hypothetical protein [Gammaproteobacteria bacterium]MCW5584189.1 hypothetical protein [Gammaproteobacteria bacterium]
MKARLIYRNKVVTEDRITELVIWELPDKTPDRPHGIKYRLYHGDKKGRCIVRYDNESGKGDHKHIGDKETLYQFATVEQLMKDFISDITRLTNKGEEEEDE